MLDELISDSEYLFRGVIINPNSWDSENNRPSSAIFKDSRGVSVDRQGVRSQEDTIEYLNNKLPLRAIVKIMAKDCRTLGAYPKADPIMPDNIYHALILDSENVIEIKSQSKAKKLRDASLIVVDNNGK